MTETVELGRLLLRPEEVAEALGVGRTMVFELIRSGELRSVKIGKSRRIPTERCASTSTGLGVTAGCSATGEVGSWRLGVRASGSPRPMACGCSARRANSEGSVYRQADGRWCATWWVPGEKRPRKATGKTQQEAHRPAGQAAGSRRGTTSGALQTVGGLADWWLHNVHRQAVRPSSWAKAEDRVRRIKDTLGELPVIDLDYRAVTEWQAGSAGSWRRAPCATIARRSPRWSTRR